MIVRTVCSLEVSSPVMSDTIDLVREANPSLPVDTFCCLSVCSAADDDDDSGPPAFGSLPAMSSTASLSSSRILSNMLSPSVLGLGGGDLDLSPLSFVSFSSSASMKSFRNLASPSFVTLSTHPVAAAFGLLPSSLPSLLRGASAKVGKSGRRSRLLFRRAEEPSEEYRYSRTAEAPDAAMAALLHVVDLDPVNLCREGTATCACSPVLLVPTKRSMVLLFMPCAVGQIDAYLYNMSCIYRGKLQNEQATRFSRGLTLNAEVRVAACYERHTVTDRLP
mmetsp:Transcript_2739/g.5718  ORF Transcript_2739/g.5718 Transcript_2739/m.5718 type:complete len:278 (-) Transcript_2739:46-879(-)